jgi:hypothetical protein
MRIHSGLLALALLVFAGLACNFSVGNTNGGNTNSGNANTGSTSNTSPSNTSSSNSSSTSSDTGGVHVTELYASKTADGDEETSFKPSDRTIYAVARLSDAKAGTKITFTWYGVDVAGHEKNSKVKDVEYTTQPNENKVTAHLTAPEDWPKGTYRIETEVGGKADKSVTYTVE